MKRNLISLFRISVGCLLVCAPYQLKADLTVNNILVEVGVSAGENSDGFGSHDFADLTLMATDGVKGTMDYQVAEAIFNLAVDEDTALGDYELIYDTQVTASTGGIGDAGGLANGIFVFGLNETFEVVSHQSDTVLNDAMGNPVELLQNEAVLLVAGNYSLSFGSSAFIVDGDNITSVSDNHSGVVSFNPTGIPEPATGLICCSLAAAFIARRRR